jgi:hypothetical protein
MLHTGDPVVIYLSPCRAVLSISTGWSLVVVTVAVLWIRRPEYIADLAVDVITSSSRRFAVYYETNQTEQRRQDITITLGLQ